MVRAPCCEKMGLKKGPWTPEEDQILINYIQLYGHGNWRALPKQAGLLRCGKSCRLRWTNYLRPDIKRGNFTREEEETIIKLHQMLGNRWSAIAARLPGRTDNEIKNVWHTHLKKRLKQSNTIQETKTHDININTKHNDNVKEEAMLVNYFPNDHTKSESSEFQPSSPPQCSSDNSSVISADNNNNNNNGHTCLNDIDFPDDFPEMDEDFWSEVYSANNNTYIASDVPGFGSGLQLEYPLSVEPVDAFSSNLHESTDFWYNVFTRAGELQELLEIM